jgi:hypothetical protein
MAGCPITSATLAAISADANKAWFPNGLGWIGLYDKQPIALLLDNPQRLSFTAATRGIR